MRSRLFAAILIISLLTHVGWVSAQDSSEPEATEEVTEVPTEEVIEAPTEEVTEAPAEELTEEPTAEPTEEVTEVVTEEPPATTVATGTEYIVQSGDNLFRIALRFGIPMSELAAANGITNPALIYVGQRLIIPGTAVTPVPTTAPETPVATTTTTPQPTSNTTYVVQPGDTLFKIAVRNNTTVAVLTSLNNLSSPNFIYSGQVLLLPGNSTAPEPTTVPTTEEPTEDAAETTPEGTPMATPEPVTMSSGIEVFVGGQDVNAITSQIQQLGVEWVKITINWRDVELEQGNLNLADYDAAINAFSGAGLNVLVQLTSAPDWARPGASEFVLSSSEYGPPDDVATFAQFASTIATRYGNKVQAYQIWNEPNLRRNWIDAATVDRTTAKLSTIAYIDLLSAAYDAIKAVDPEVYVITAGLAPTGLNDGVNAYDDRIYLRDLLAANVTDHSDGIGVHADGFANPPDARSPEQGPGIDTHFDSPRFFFLDTLEDYHNILLEAGSDATLWVTRFGWGTAEGNALVQPDEFSIFLTYTSPEEQALYTVRAFELGAELGYVGPMILFNLNGCEAGRPEACYYSLVDSSTSARPAFSALVTTATEPMTEEVPVEPTMEATPETSLETMPEATLEPTPTDAG